MPFIALKRLNFGDSVIDPGQEVPLEPGRDYDLMKRSGEVVWSEAPAAAHAVAGASQRLEKAAVRKRAPSKGISPTTE